MSDLIQRLRQQADEIDRAVARDKDDRDSGVFCEIEYMREAAAALAAKDAELAAMRQDYQQMRDAADSAATKAGERQGQIDKLREALEPFVETARRQGWDKLEDDHPDLNLHVVNSPADDIAPGAFYCLQISEFRRAALAAGQRDGQ